MNTNPTTRPKVQRASRLIQKPSDLFAAADGHLIAVRALRFGERTFDEDQGPKPVAEIAVVDLEGPEPRPLAMVEVSWARLIGQLKVADRDSWQIGRLVEEPEYHARELEPPDEDVDLEGIADKLGQLHAATLTRPQQLALDSAPDTGPDDEIPF